MSAAPEIKIEQRGTSVTLAAPFHPDCSKKAKLLGGKWDDDARLWVFDARDIEWVRELAIDLYGDDGQPCERVTVRITNTCGKHWYADREGIWIGGREIAAASGRDSGARVGKGVVFLKGGPGSGGSMKNWETRIPAGAVFEIRDIPRAMVEEVTTWVDTDGTVEVIEPEPAQEPAAAAEPPAPEPPAPEPATDRIAALEARINALEARLDAMARLDRSDA